MMLQLGISPLRHDHSRVLTVVSGLAWSYGRAEVNAMVADVIPAMVNARSLVD